MKKILSLILMFLTVLLLSGCNKQIVDFKYQFKKVHIIQEKKCYEIEKWKDYQNSDQIQVKIKDYGYCLFHSNQIILVEDKCPICD